MKPGTVTDIRGVGDRWLAGEAIDGVDFPLHARVMLTLGRHAGKTGTVAFLMNLDEDPLYLVELQDGSGDVRVRGAGMRRL